MPHRLAAVRHVLSRAAAGSDSSPELSPLCRLVEKRPAMIEALIHQPFAMGDGRALGLVQLGHEGMPHRKRQAPCQVAIRLGDTADAGLGRRAAGMVYDGC